ncbi:maleylpyruvate isomerase N-terminal domain-containing protein [Nonomuraea sp. NPDC026600]|uniref:maleylpyruvate isomerase N-terminal domain-containing protein n=1 Tax=Nonomuraea sp. NPDC026600 TaxID=3155363 RepID=UPI00340D641B
MTVLLALQAEPAAATDRFLATAASLTGDDVAAPSRLPGWSRGHVLSHMAGHADSHINLLTWARTGIETPRHPTAEARATGIEAGADRTGGPAADVRPPGTPRLPAFPGRTPRARSACAAGGRGAAWTPAPRSRAARPRSWHGSSGDPMARALGW